MTTQTAAQDAETFEIISFHNCQGGLGITLAEYQLSDASDDPSSTLILVKDIRADGRAASDGRLRRGDKLVRVNGQPIRNMTLPAAAKTLADAIESGRATLAVSRDPALAAAFGNVATNRSVIPGGDARVESDCSKAEADAPLDESVPGRTEADSRRTSSESGADRHADEIVLTSGTCVPTFADYHEGIGLFASTSANVLSDGASPFPDISNDMAMGKLDDLPFCSTPNSTLTDVTSSYLWRKPVESSISRAHPAGLPLEAMYADASMIKLEKLELAMSFLGIHLTKAEEVEVQRLVETDGSGRVDFTKFVEKMRQLLRSRLSLLRRQSAASGPSAAAVVIGSPAMQPQPQPQQQSPHSSLSLSSSRRPSPTVGRDTAYLHQLPPIGYYSSPQGDVRRQVLPVASTTNRPNSGCGTGSSKLVTSSAKTRTRDIAQQTDAADEAAMVRQMQTHIRELEDTLRVRDQQCHTTEQKAARMRQKFLTADAQCKSLQSRLELAEAAQRASRSAEIDYEAVLLAVERALEDKQPGSERTEQRTTLRGSTPAAKRIAILGCQLRKAEESRKVYEVATERLLSFVRVVHEIADKSANPDKGRATAAASTSGEVEQGARSCGLTQRESKDLADRAMSIISATQALLEMQPLPFGWEEAYTADGKKYYLNHVTEETVWQHPLTKVARQEL